MSDGSIFKIIASYGFYTGKSEDEYLCLIYIEGVKNDTIDKR